MTTLLRTALRLNALFSLTTGLILLFGAFPVSDWLGIPAWVAIVVGVGLVPFAVMVWRASGRLDPAEVTSIVVADIVWVVASAIFVVGWSHLLSDAGLKATVAVAVVVGGFALAQWVGAMSIRVTESDAART